MHLIPIKTAVIRQGDDLTAMFMKQAKFQKNDILVVSSKVIATAEGAIIDLASMEVSGAAKKWSDACGRSPEFCEAVLQETHRLHGTVVGSCPGALLTEVRPDGLATGTILAANAGLDQSNMQEGFAIGWPQDPVTSVHALRFHIKERAGVNIAVILTDSCCRPRRLGVTAFALTVSGLDPLVSQAGKNDLFGHPLRITTEAIADQLATAANFLMGNAGQATPAVIIRDHGIPLSDYEGWVHGIEPHDDLFAGIL